MRLFIFALCLTTVCFSLSACVYGMHKPMPFASEAEAAAPMPAMPAPEAARPGSMSELMLDGRVSPVRNSEAVKPLKAAGRKVIYTGSITVLVANKATGRQELDKIIKKYDGLIGSATLDEVTFRVAPEQFEAALNDVAALGETAGKEIKSEDVTAQFFDLGLRIGVAEGSRQRLMEILKKTGAVKDVLEVERDIRRLTEEIETLKGSQRLMQSQIELATIRVTLREKELVAQPRRREIGSIFAWINNVGMDRVLAGVGEDESLRGEVSLTRWFRGPRFRLAAGGALLPAGFLPVRYNENELLGVTPQDDRLRVLRLDLRQDGKLDFWAAALGEEFKNFRGYIVRGREDFKLDDGKLQGVVLRCETAQGSQPWAYDVWIVQRPSQPKKLTVIEYARAKKTGDEILPAIEQAVRGIKVR